MPSPFEEHRDELSVARDDDPRFLGNTMFWRYFDRIAPKHLYRPPTVEYRSTKLMALETTLVIALAVLFSVYTVYAYGGRWEPVTLEQKSYWSTGVDSLQNVDGVYDWMEQHLIPNIFPQADSLGDTSNVTTPPDGWLLMDSASAGAYVESSGLYEVTSSNPGWTPHYLGGTPFTGNVLLGSVRVRQIAVQGIPGCTPVGALKCFPSDFEHAVQNKTKTVPSDASNEAQSAFIWRPHNYTLQPAIDGTEFEYPGDGYIFEIPPDKTDATSALAEIRAAGWLDNSAIVVIVESTILSSRVNAVVNTVVTLEISDGVPASTVKSTAIPLPSRGANLPMILLIVVFGFFVCYGLYLMFLLTKTGIVDFFGYFWNLYDLITVIIFFCLVGLIITPFEAPSILSPVYAPLQAWFMPFSNYAHHVSHSRNLASIVGIMVWCRLLKPLVLVGSARPVIVVLHRSITDIVVGGVLLKFGTAFLFIGLGMYLSMRGSEEFAFFQSYSSSLYALAFMLGRGTSGILSSNGVTVAMYIIFVLVFLLALPGIVVGTHLHKLRAYDAEVRAVKRAIDSDQTALYPAGVDRTSFWHNDLFRIFWYSWLSKVVGRTLIEELEEDVGTPDEQQIDLDLLPLLVQDRWRAKRNELLEFMSPKKKTIKGNDEDNFTSKATKLFLSPLRSPRKIDHAVAGTFARTAVAKNESVITRIQLQRLLDSDEDLVRALVTTDNSERGKKRALPVVTDRVLHIRAVDLIRKYSTREATTRKHIFENLLGNVSLARIGGENISRGLAGTIQEVDEAWKSKFRELSDLVATWNNEITAAKLPGTTSRRIVN